MTQIPNDEARLRFTLGDHPAPAVRALGLSIGGPYLEHYSIDLIGPSAVWTVCRRHARPQPKVLAPTRRRWQSRWMFTQTLENSPQDHRGGQVSYLLLGRGQFSAVNLSITWVEGAPNSEQETHRLPGPPPTGRRAVRRRPAGGRPRC